MTLFLETSQMVGLILGGVGGAIVLALLVFVLIKFVFIRSSINKSVKELERKYSYLDALLIGQDSQYVKRLEIISRTNLLYVDIYANYSKRFKQVYEIDDKYAEGVLKQLNSLIASRQYRNIKTVVAEGKKAVGIFEKSATELDDELSNLIKPEEEARQAILKLKERFRTIKQTYYANQGDLEMAAQSFETVFSKLEQKFIDFESHIESAEYEEAKAIIPMVGKVLDELAIVLEKEPSLCVLVMHVIPDRIRALQNEQDDLEAQDYPLYHLMVSQAIDDYEERLKSMEHKLVNLQVNGIDADCSKIQEDIENIHTLFMKEVAAKEYFDSNCSNVYSSVMDLEKSFLRLCSLLPEMNRIYLIDETESARIEELKGMVNRLGSAKRLLDTFIHSATKQPYSTLASKLQDLEKDYEAAKGGVNSFKVFLEGLKNSSEEAYSMVFSYYYRTKQVEQMIRKIGLKDYTKKYMEMIEGCYSLLNDVDKAIKVTPIDVHLVHDKVEELKKLSDQVSSEVEKDTNVQQLAESSIIYANRDRNHQNDVHQALKVYEEEFFKGDFDKCYHDVVDLLRRQHVEDQSGN